MTENKNEEPNKTIRQNDSPSVEGKPTGEKRKQDIEKTIAATLPKDAEEIKAAEADVALEWNIGDVILDLYEVKEIHKGGGMGLVYRVSHRGWNIDLAVKSPRADWFKTEEQKENFVRECETWINLGLHPHIVSCYYVRTLGGIPRIFSEYVEGGSLSGWIKEHKLYEGGHKKALERILDIAIQFAWGLHYAHEQRLIHQDVKPANVMMTPDGTTKVTDFGLAKARGLAGEGAEAVPDRNVFVSAGDLMTPAYCSPEQANKKKLSRKTDIWSWGLSVLEMFTGEVTWIAGQAAAEVLESYVETGAEDKAIPIMPENLVELLRQCFQRDPDERPKDMKEIITELMQSYQSATGEEYTRPEPKAADLLADGLNNRAVSLLDLGRREEAESQFEEALKFDPHHTEVTYNRGLLLWRSGRMTDDVLVKQLEEVRATHKEDWRDEYYLGLVHIERGDSESAVKVLKEALSANPEESEVRRSLGVARSGQGKWHSGGEIVLPNDMAFICSCGVSPKYGMFFLRSKDRTNLMLFKAGSIQFKMNSILDIFRTGKCLKTFKGHSGKVNSVCFSPDGRWALSGSDDETMKLWDLATGECLKTFEGHTYSVYSVSISPDGRWGLSASMDKTARLWDLATGQCLRTFKVSHISSKSVCFSPNGCWTLLGDGWKFGLWDLATGECLRTFEGHRAYVESVCFSPDGQWGLSGSWDTTMKLWDLATGECLKTFEGHTGSVESVCFSPDGCWALSGGGVSPSAGGIGGSDQTVKLWDLATGVCLRTFKGHTGSVESVCFSPNGHEALSVSSFELMFYNVGGQGPLGGFAVALPRSSTEIDELANKVYKALKNARLALERESPSDALAEVTKARKIHGYERNTELLELLQEVGQKGRLKKFKEGWCSRNFWGHSGTVKSVAFSQDSCRALSGSGDNTMRLWDLATGECLMATSERPGMEKHFMDVKSVAFSPDGQWGLSGSWDTRIGLWDLVKGKKERDFIWQNKRANSVCINPDGRWALSGYAAIQYNIVLWDLATGECLRTFEGHRADVESVCFSPDGQWGLSGGWDTTMKLWDLATGECLKIFEGHTRSVKSVCFSPDGRRALSGSDDKTMRLWDLVTGKSLMIFEGHTGSVESVCFSPDGQWGLSGSRDNTMSLWNLAIGVCLQTFEAHSDGVRSISINPDGRRVLSGGGDKILRLWEFVWDYVFPEPTAFDEGARPYLEIFLTLHCPYGDDGIKRVGTPHWNEEDFKKLLKELQYRGYGWLRPEGVRRELERMTKEWKGLPSL